jgi:type 2 lantibiotic biosynthesis protein LanM
LLELAFFGEEEVSWVGLELLREKFWGLSALGPYLYDGMLGLSYFLAYLGHNTGETRFTQTARAALQTHRQIEKKRPSWKPEDIGAFSGLGGKIFTLSHLGIIWQEPELWQEAEGYFDVLTRLIREDKIYDIIGGAAGCLAGLFALHKCQPSARLLALARQCGDHLLQNSISLPNGAGWQSPGVKQPLAGFSHGAAGISALLMELAALTGEEKYHETALAAIAHERTLFFGKAQNWPNRSELSPDETNEESLANHCMTAWCHGAPGVGLGRLRAWPFYSEASVADEINIAVKTTLETGLGANHSICHGDLGNLDFLLQASLAFSDSSLQQRVYQLAGSLQRCIEEHGWLCGVPFGVETPGLMNGLAGIGYGLLRLSDPKRVPSLLTLSPPIA